MCRGGQKAPLQQWQEPLMKIHHVGIAVKSLEQALPIFRRLTGTEPDSVEEVPDQKVRAAVFGLGESQIELLEATAPDSPIARFLDKGGKGVHHLTLAVSNLDQTLAGLEGDGFRLIDRQPRIGAGGQRIAFLHPSSTSGVLIELVEERDGDEGVARTPPSGPRL